MLTLTYRGDVYVKSDHGMGWDEGGGVIIIINLGCLKTAKYFPDTCSQNCFLDFLMLQSRVLSSHDI